MGYDFKDLALELNPSLNEKHRERLDIAVRTKNGLQTIIIEAKRYGFFHKEVNGAVYKEINKYYEKNIETARLQLSAYVNHLRDAKLAIITDGGIYYFYRIDRDNLMLDSYPFSTLSLENIYNGGGLNDSILSTLVSIHKDSYDEKTVEYIASINFMRKTLKEFIKNSIEDPDEGLVSLFCKKAIEKYKEEAEKKLKNNGIERVLSFRKVNLTKEDCMEQFKVAFKEIIENKASDKLGKNILDKKEESSSIFNEEDGTEYTIEEQTLFNYVHTVAPIFLKKFDKTDKEIKDILTNVNYKDYKGSFAIYYKQVQNGAFIKYNQKRGLFDFPFLNKKNIECDIERLHHIANDIMRALKNRIDEIG